MSDRPFAYICSPLRGDVEANTARAREYCRQVFEAGYIPLASHVYFPAFLRDDIPEERTAGMDMGLALLPMCRVLVICGDTISEGMKREIHAAERFGIPILTLDAFLPETVRNRPPAPAPEFFGELIAIRKEIAAADKRLVNGYEIIQSVKIDGMEIIVGENPDAKESYMMWRRSLGESFGSESHLIPVFSNDYLKILRDFIHCQSVYADNLDLDRIYRGSLVTDAALDAKDCVVGGMDSDLKGKVAAIRADALSPEYRTQSHQLMLVTAVFGCSPDANGRAVYGTNIYSGTQERWNRADIIGVVSENNLPNWAREKLTTLQKPAEKESVLDKIRQGQQASSEQKHPKTKNRSKGEQEH